MLAAMVLCSSVAEPGKGVRHKGFSVHVCPSTVTLRSPSSYTLVTFPIFPRAWKDFICFNKSDASFLFQILFLEVTAISPPTRHLQLTGERFHVSIRFPNNLKQIQSTTSRREKRRRHYNWCPKSIKVHLPTALHPPTLHGLAAVVSHELCHPSTLLHRQRKKQINDKWLADGKSNVDCCHRIELEYLLVQWHDEPFRRVLYTVGIKELLPICHPTAWDNHSFSKRWIQLTSAMRGFHPPWPSCISRSRSASTVTLTLSPTLNAGTPPGEPGPRGVLLAESLDNPKTGRASR